MVFVGAFAPDAPPGPPPGEALGGFQSIAPGGGGTFNVNVTPGNYVFLCFVEDLNTGAPHFALDMLEEFSIQHSVFSRAKLSLWALHNSDEKPPENPRASLWLALKFQSCVPICARR